MKAKRKLANGRSSRWALWDRFEVPDYDTDGTYLVRIRILQTPLFGVYLHRFDGPDPRDTLHDHPWAWTSIVLRGGYEERRLDPHTMIVTNEVVKRVNRKRPHNAHAIIRLLRVPTWTLFLVGRRQRTWGYWEPIEDLDFEDEAAQEAINAVGAETRAWVWTEFSEHLHAEEFDAALARRREREMHEICVRLEEAECTHPDGPCICANGIGCVNVPVEAW